MSDKNNQQHTKQHMLVVGAYNDSYPRNEILLKALKNNYELKQYTFLKQKFLYFSFVKTLIRHFFWADVVFVMWPARTFWFVLLVLRIFYRKKIIIDAFNSDYETYVIDRKIVTKKSLKAWYYLWTEKIFFNLANFVFFDTKEHQDYFEKQFNIKRGIQKEVLPISVDISLFNFSLLNKEINLPKNKKIILFFGYYIPLQGIEYIIRAAHLLRKKENIHFVFIGSGQTRPEIDKLVTELYINNATFLPRIPFKDMLPYFACANIILGIFGTSDKADRVIPNKVIEGMASGKTVITGENTSMKAVFSDKKDILFCKRGDAEDLARVIEHTIDSGCREEIGRNARKKIEKEFSLVSLKKKISAIM